MTVCGHSLHETQLIPHVCITAMGVVALDATNFPGFSVGH